MARKEDKQPQYLPLVVKARLHTGGRDYDKIKQELKGQGFTCKQMQEEVDNIDHEAVKRQVAAAEDAQYQKRRKQRQRRKQASKGSRYQRKYF